MNDNAVKLQNEFLEEYEYPSDPTQAEIWSAIDSYTQWLSEKGVIEKKDAEGGNE